MVYSSSRLRRRTLNEDDIKNKDALKNEDNLKNEDDLKKDHIIFCLYKKSIGDALTPTAVRPFFNKAQWLSQIVWHDFLTKLSLCMNIRVG